MDENKIKLPIRSALIPNFYTNFHCLAQDCKDSCCVGWRISFDKKDYLRLRRLEAPEALKERLEAGVRRERSGNHDGILYGKFDLDSNSGRCPFLDPDGLCSIQRACGHEALPRVCTSYPRKIGYSPAAKEYTLSPSCEGVLQQLWDLPDGVEFVEDPLSKVEYRERSITLGESLTLYFAPIRAFCIDLLQDRTIPLARRMLFLGVALQRLQSENWADFDPDVWTEHMAQSISAEAEEFSVKASSASRRMYLMQNLRVLQAIEANTKGWPAELFDALGATRQFIMGGQESGPQTVQLTTNYSPDAYEEALERFQTAFADREYFFENLMVAVALYLDIPLLSSKEELWKGYVSLSSLYSFYRFVSVLGCKENTTKERLFHMIVMASRATLHSRDRFNKFQEELFQNDSATLAHMAILLYGG